MDGVGKPLLPQWARSPAMYDDNDDDSMMLSCVDVPCPLAHAHILPSSPQHARVHCKHRKGEPFVQGGKLTAEKRGVQRIGRRMIHSPVHVVRKGMKERESECVSARGALKMGKEKK